MQNLKSHYLRRLLLTFLFVATVIALVTYQFYRGDIEKTHDAILHDAIHAIESGNQIISSSLETTKRDLIFMLEILSFPVVLAVVIDTEVFGNLEKPVLKIAFGLIGADFLVES